MELTYLKPDEIAKHMMLTIQIDNGMVNRFREAEYPERWVDRISSAAEDFFRANPIYLNEEIIYLMCTYEQAANDILFGHLEGWRRLNDELNNYFNGEEE